MAKKNALIVAIAAFLMISSSLAIVIDYNNSDNVSGDFVDYSDWIKISDPEQLSKIGSGEWTEIVGGEEIKHNYPADGKYVLMNDIIFTDEDTGVDMDLNGGFDMRIMVVGSGTSIGIFPVYSDNSSVKSDAEIIISLNGEVATISPGDVGYTFTGVFGEYVDITIGGIANNVPGNPDVKMNFAFSITQFFLYDSVSTIYSIKSNGNMDPLCSSQPFTGTFHGNGHKIIGLETAVNGSGGIFSALFGQVNGAIFDGIGLIDGSSVAVSSANSYAGGLVGYGIYTSTITNCYNSGNVSVTASSSSSDSYAGGLIGYGSDAGVEMTNCYNTGPVSVTSVSSASALTCAGGLVGRGDSKMTNCYNTGSASVTSASSSVSSLTLVSSYAGGLIGYGNSTMTNCYNTGSASVISSSPSYAGGLIGSGSTITMTDCYNTGDVSATSPYSYAGGLIGRGSMTTKMTNCYNTGSVSVISSSPYSYAGGLIGYGNSTMTNCYNIGDVSVTSSSSSPLYAGGLIGYGNGATMMTNCYTIREISVTGTNVYKGGMIGSGAGTIYITNCYFYKPSASSLELFDNRLTGVIVDGLQSGARDPSLTASGSKSLSDLANKATYYTGETEYLSLVFPGWDFDNIWCMDGGVNYGFPFLGPTAIMGQPSDVTADKVDGNVFSIRLGATGGTVQWQKFTGGQWNDIPGATGLTYITEATDAFEDKFRCVVTVGGDVFTSNSASLLEASIDDPGTDDPGTDDPGTDGPGDGDGNGNDGNGGDDGGDNTMLFVGIGIAAVAAIGVVGYFVFVRKP